MTGRALRAVRLPLVLLTSVALTLLMGCSGPSPAATSSGPTPKDVDASGCPVSPRLVPSCGALWGVTTEQPTTQSLSQAEASVGRQFDFVYRFHDLNDVVPTPDERAIVKAGRTLHISIDSRNFTPGAAPISWASVARGDWDDSLRRQAKGVASLGVPVFVTFEHEADQPRKATLGTPADFRAAWRHVHTVFENAGASNAIWTWVATGWEPSFATAGALWPGNDVVDWISWEGYNQSGCQSGKADPNRYVSFQESIDGFYQWLTQHGPAAGIDISKPIMISEAGSVLYPQDPGKTANWYAAIPSTLQKYPQIKAIGLWDHTGTGGPACDFRFSLAPKVLSAVKQAGKRGWVNTPALDR